MRLKRTHAQSSNLARIPGVAHGAHKQPLSGRRWRSLRVVPQPQNLTGWVSLSDGCAGQYNGSQPHQRQTGRRRTQRRGLQRRRRRQLGQRQLRRRRGQRRLPQRSWPSAERAQTQNFPRLRRANSMAPCGAAHRCRGEARGKKPVRISSSPNRTAAQALTQLSSR